MRRIFQGSKDKSVIILDNVFPESDLVISAPFQFEGERSGVYVEGNYKDLENIFKHLLKLQTAYIEEQGFGKWVSVLPPEHFEKVIVYYEVLRGELDKIKLLNLTLRQHLAEVCDLRLNLISKLIIRVEGHEVYKTIVPLPDYILNGEILLRSR